MKIRTLIVDDERLARQRLRRLLAEHASIEVVGECEDGKSTLMKVREENPHLLLIDIRMPGIDGIETVEALGEGSLPVVIFVTAFDQHAIRAFEACALDYLLKPVSPARLAKALVRAGEQLALLQAGSTHPAESEPAAPKRFHVRSGQRTSFVAPEEIDWIEAGGNYVILHVGPQNHLLRATMAGLESSMPKAFLRIGRSAMVNLRSVKELQATGAHHFAVMKDGTRVPLTISVREVQRQLRAL